MNSRKLSLPPLVYIHLSNASHTSTRIKGDRKVNLALDNRLERECNYTRKKSVTAQIEETYLSAFGQNTVQGEIPGTTPEVQNQPLTLLDGETLDPEIILLATPDLSPPEDCQRSKTSK